MELVQELYNALGAKGKRLARTCAYCYKRLRW